MAMTMHMKTKLDREWGLWDGKGGGGGSGQLKEEEGV